MLKTNNNYVPLLLFSESRMILVICGIDLFSGVYFLKKGNFVKIGSLEQVLFLTISNEKTFFENSGHHIASNICTQQRSRISPDNLQ